MVFTGVIFLQTKGFCDIIDITQQVCTQVNLSSVKDGLVTIFCPGSTGTVTTIEYESGALKDLTQALERIAPMDINYQHDQMWGDGNDFSHVRAALMKPSITVPLVGGKLTLGVWQQIIFIDFDNRKRHREIIVQIVGD